MVEETAPPDSEDQDAELPASDLPIEAPDPKNDEATDEEQS
jgi:hypothetical protein